MNKELLPKGFLRKHPLAQYSAASFADLGIRIIHADELNEEIDKIVSPTIEASRRAAVLQEKKQIDALNTPEAVVAQMRKDTDVLNQNPLCKKALSMQDEVLPLILKRYKSTFQVYFVETSVRILGNADRKYTAELLDMYKEIRNPYAQSMACLLFGEHELEEAVPLLLSEFERLKKQYPDESYDQEPLLALHIMYGEET